MKKILVDSSIWINYFNNKRYYNILTELIIDNQICTNNLVLTELIPFLKIKKMNELITALLEVDSIPININWEIIMNYQLINLKNGINKVGIPDLIILDNVISNNLILFTADKHFILMNEYLEFSIFNE